MNLVSKRASWSNMALFSSFVLGMLFHRGASTKNVFTGYIRQFESKKAFNKRTKFNNGQKQAATKCKGDKEFDVNILFMN